MNKLKKWLANPIIAGSVLMIVGSNLINFLNYLYHFVMGRLLGPDGYGELAALLSILSLLSIVPSAFGLVIVKFISTSRGKKAVTGLVNFFTKLVLVVGVLVVVVSVLSGTVIGHFLQINQPWLFLGLAVSFIFGTLAFVNKSTLQGLVRFKELIISGLVENATKLSVGIFLVWIGFSVSGAVIGLLLAAIVGWLISGWFIREYRSRGTLEPERVRAVAKYTLPVFVQSFAMVSLSSADIILVKHFFDPTQAGVYAAVSALSRIILFASGPVSAVMFPWVARKQASNQNYWSVFSLSFGLTALICFGVLGFYLILPELSIGLLYGNAFLAGSELLFGFGVFMTMLTLSMFLTNFYLSLGKVKMMLFPLVAAGLQIAGIWLWHTSLFTVVWVSVFVCGGLLAALLAGLWPIYLAQRR